MKSAKKVKKEVFALISKFLDSCMFFTYLATVLTAHGMLSSSILWVWTFFIFLSSRLDHHHHIIHQTRRWVSAIVSYIHVFFCFFYAVIGSSCSRTSPCRAGVVYSIRACDDGYIQSYSYPNSYGNYVDRSWYLANPGASTLRLVLLEFNVRKIFFVPPLYHTVPEWIFAILIRVIMYLSGISQQCSNAWICCFLLAETIPQSSVWQGSSNS